MREGAASTPSYLLMWRKSLTVPLPDTINKHTAFRGAISASLFPIIAPSSFPFFFFKWGPDAWLTFVPALPEGIRHQTLLRCSRAIRSNVENLNWSVCEGPARTRCTLGCLFRHARRAGLRDTVEEVGLLISQQFFSHLSRMAQVSEITQIKIVF